MTQKLLKTFGDLTRNSLIVSAGAPGTVTLLGSHASYNHGFALAIATPHQTLVEVAESPDDLNYFCAVDKDMTVTCSLGESGSIQEEFALSLYGCLMVLEERGFPVSPVCALVRSELPLGAGLADGAARDVAMIRALGRLFGFRLEEMSLARLAHRVELEYAQVTSGLVDQVASCFGDTTTMLLLDTRSLDTSFLPFPDGAELVVVESGLPSAFGDWHPVRREECVAACRLLGVATLRDVTDVAALAVLPPQILPRARHVVTENARVLEVAGGVSAERLGELLTESHKSLRDDYEVSLPTIDLLTELFLDDPRTYGARLAGAGMGGSCLALVQRGTAADVARQVLTRYREKGGRGQLLIPQPND
jgi:galactokinase